jgi:hypothetical protein
MSWLFQPSAPAAASDTTLAVQSAAIANEASGTGWVIQNIVLAIGQAQGK